MRGGAHARIPIKDSVVIFVQQRSLAEDTKEGKRNDKENDKENTNEVCGRRRKRREELRRERRGARGVTRSRGDALEGCEGMHVGKYTWLESGSWGLKLGRWQVDVVSGEW